MPLVQSKAWDAAMGCFDSKAVLPHQWHWIPDFTGRKDPWWACGKFSGPESSSVDMVMFGELLWSTRPMWVECKQSEATSGKPLSPALHSGISVSQSQTWASVSEMRESRDFRGQCFYRGWFPPPQRMGRRTWRKEKQRDTEAHELGDVLKEEVVGGWVRNPPKGCTSKRKGMLKICGNYSKEEREREQILTHQPSLSPAWGFRNDLLRAQE